MLLCDDAPGELSVVGEAVGDTIFEDVGKSAVTRRATRKSGLFEVRKKYIQTGWVTCDNGDVPLDARFTC